MLGDAATQNRNESNCDQSDPGAVTWGHRVPYNWISANRNSDFTTIWRPGQLATSRGAILHCCVSYTESTLVPLSLSTRNMKNCSGWWVVSSRWCAATTQIGRASCRG